MKSIGSLEKISFPTLGVLNVWAKIDTGAYSGALHCTNIKVTGANISHSERKLSFWPLGKQELAYETTRFIERYARSATGHRVKRYIITTNIEIAGETFDINIGLSDRSRMKRHVLIGRKFLRDNNLLVDARINQDHDHEKEYA